MDETMNIQGGAPQQAVRQDGQQQEEKRLVLRTEGLVKIYGKRTVVKIGRASCRERV